MADPLTVVIPHKLGKAEARARIDSGLDRFEQQMFGLQSARMQRSWADDRLSLQTRILGQRVSGRIDVGDRDIRIEVDLPGFLGRFADKVAGKLQREGRLLLEPRRPS
jgi:hypothetical protein